MVRHSKRESRRALAGPYYVLFFLSGVPALVYQILWQRALFTIYGVNIESVTVIVTVFMLGLGFGSLVGGRLAMASGVPLLATFGAVELAIGLFGALSLPLFHRVAVSTAGAPVGETIVATMALLLLPTLLMGSTLPLLATHFVRLTRNVGESVGALYAVNTAGSAVACIAAATFSMRWLGESGSVRAAAAVNIIVGVSAMALQFLERTDGALPIAGPPTEPIERLEKLPLRAAVLLAAVVGFVALAYEILWYRAFAFVSGGAAPAFALVLGFYLGGVALGSLFVRDLSRDRLKRKPENAVGLLGSIIVWGSVLSFFVVPALAALVKYAPYQLAYPLVFVGPSLMGAAFPLLSHVAIPPSNRAGSRVSYLYVANIIGSVAGSLVVGYILFDHWSIATTSLLLLALASGSTIVLLPRSHGASRQWATAGLLGAVAAAVFSTSLYSNLYERLLYKLDYSPTLTFRHLVENRSGVIAVAEDGTVFGGGVYDGQFSVDLVHDTNNLFRAFAIGAFHPRPAEVLMVGLASGSWAQVIANNPDVKRLTIIEINPGYLQLIPQYPAVASMLHNPKVDIVIDDGRRWLVAHPERKFDLTVMNTTFHWRANASNVLSAEFLSLVRQHLAPGGIHYYNTTGSGDVLLTGATVFPYSLRVRNFLAVSDSPIDVDPVRWKSLLSVYTLDGKRLFDLSDASQRRRLDEVVALTDSLQDSRPDAVMEPGDRLRRRLMGYRLITDDNMGTEWSQ